MRILARPYKNTAEGGQGRVYDVMAEQGHHVEEFGWKAAFLGRYDILHMHYPEQSVRRPERLRTLVAVTLLLALFAMLRIRRIPIVGTGHNERSHEQHHPTLEKVVYRAFDRTVAGMTYPSETSRNAVQAARPTLRDVPSAIVPLVNYRWEVSGVTRAEARTRLGLPPDDTVILFLGLIRRYKNVPHLITTFRELDRPGTQLLIAGNPDADLVPELERSAGGDERVHLLLRYIEPAEVSELMAAANGLAMPFRRVMNSGSTVLALSHNRPVLVPRVGALEELADNSGSEWFRFFESSGGDDAGLDADVLGEAIDHFAGEPAGRPDLAWCDLETVAEQTTEFFRRFVAA